MKREMLRDSSGEPGMYADKGGSWRLKIPMRGEKHLGMSGSDFPLQVLNYVLSIEFVRAKILKTRFSLSASIDLVKPDFSKSFVEFLLPL
jgi:hypothetical protein